MWYSDREAHGVALVREIKADEGRRRVVMRVTREVDVNVAVAACGCAPAGESTVFGLLVDADDDDGAVESTCRVKVRVDAV